jgi:hypothetical protein
MARERLAQRVFTRSARIGPERLRSAPVALLPVAVMPVVLMPAALMPITSMPITSMPVAPIHRLVSLLRH